VAPFLTLGERRKLKIRLFYTDLPFWRAEVSRLALHIGKIDFEDVRLKWRDDFDIMINTGKLPYGVKSPFRQIPVLEVDGQVIGQTAGIARFCGKLSGMYPKNDDILAAKIDQIIDAASDITNLIGLTMKKKDSEKKIIARYKLSNETLPKWFSFLENLLHENKPNKWFAGNSMSVADLAIWRLLGWIISGKIEHVPTTILEPFNVLKNHYKIVDSHPKVVEWMSLKYGK
jgi:glutathione S-transferase